MDLQPGIQSAFDPQGPNAAAIARLMWVLFAGGAAIFVLVIAIAAWALLAPRLARRPIANERFVLLGGVAFTFVVLASLLVYSFSLADDVGPGKAPAATRVVVIGHQWWWRVRYLDADGEVAFETANEIRIPVGEPVDLELHTADVLHSFWVPNLAGKLDMIPGRVNRLRIRADRAGTFRGQCAEYCGEQHAQMALFVVAEPQQVHAAWQQRQRAPAAPDPEDLHRRGREVFLSRCSVCHTVRGTPAAGSLGPDLTHVGSRLSIAAGILPNNVGTLAGWIASSQHIKPGNLMPSIDDLSAPDLLAVAGWLAALE